MEPSLALRPNSEDERGQRLLGTKVHSSKSFSFGRMSTRSSGSMATHTRFPRNFTPDLRRLKSWPSMKGSLWRQPYLIELTYAKNFQLVKESIPGKNLKILEVGCGTGFMSLELARMGHYVAAIDQNKNHLSRIRIQPPGSQSRNLAIPDQKNLGGSRLDTTTTSAGKTSRWRQRDY